MSASHDRFERRYVCRDGVLRTMAQIEARAEEQRRQPVGKMKGERVVAVVLDEAEVADEPH